MFFKRASIAHVQVGIIVLISYLFITLSSIVTRGSRFPVVLVTRASHILSDAAHYASQARHVLKTNSTSDTKPSTWIRAYTDAHRAKNYTTSVRDIFGSEAIREYMGIDIDALVSITHQLVNDLSGKIKL
jgi:hypothetical protein